MTLEKKVATGNDPRLSSVGYINTELARLEMNMKILQNVGKVTLYNPQQMDIIYIDTDEKLEQHRLELERSKILMVDLEGVDLGPKGTVTMIQMNNFITHRCWLLDVHHTKLGKKHLLTNGWVRKLFEQKVIVMWSAENDLSNLNKDYGVSIPHLVDLQIIESNNRQKMQQLCQPAFKKEYQKSFKPGTSQRLSLKRAYDYFIDSKSDLAKYKLGMNGQDYSVWGFRPLNDDLLGYAAFDVASLRQLLQKFSRIVDFTNEDVVWTVLQDSLNRKEPDNARVNVKSNRIQKQLNALALERRYQRKEKKKQIEAGRGVLKGLIITKMDVNANINLTLSMPREIDVSSGIDFDNTNFKKGEPVELARWTGSGENRKRISFNGFITDISIQTTCVAINPRQPGHEVDQFEDYVIDIEKINFAPKEANFELVPADYDLIDVIEDAGELISDMIHKEDRAEANIQRMLKVLFETETPLPIDLNIVRDSNGKISKGFRPKRELNPEQQNALMYGLAVKDVFCLHGPPGTGKSTTIGELVTILAKKNMKILIAAPSNAAVDVMLAKISENLPNLNIIRAGNYFKTASNVKKYHFETIFRNDPNWFRLCKLSARSRGKNKKRIREQLKEIEDSILRDIIPKATVIAGTCMSVGLRVSQFLDLTTFDVTIIDEAGQGNEPEMYPIISKCAGKVILAGDPLQLPPTVFNEQMKHVLEDTLMQNLMDKYPQNTVMLKTQHRMNKVISDWVSKRTYKNELMAHHEVANHVLEHLPTVQPGKKNTFIGDLLKRPMTFIDTQKTMVENQRETSKMNKGEAGVVIYLVKKMMRQGLPANKIAVISPYKAQVQFLLSYLPKGVHCKSVDGYQGGEAELVILSFVRSNGFTNDRRSIGFLHDERRLNVAVSRARRGLICIGSAPTISKIDYLSDMIGYIQAHKGLKNIDDIIQGSNGDLKKECSGVGHVIRKPSDSQQNGPTNPPGDSAGGAVAASRRSRNRRYRSRNQPPSHMMATLSLRT